MNPSDETPCTRYFVLKLYLFAQSEHTNQLPNCTGWATNLNWLIAQTFNNIRIV